ncbi:MAG: hypothetical protein U0T73_01810 [Chitinophagales bacterium]
MELKEKIADWLQPELDREQLFLVDVRAANKAKIEVFVDGDKGITIGQCATLSRFLEKLLDGTDYVTENYTLDVSSPGMDNPLKVPRQYKKRIGRTLEIITVAGAQREAELIAADDEKIVVRDIVKEKKKKKNAPETAPEPPKETTLRYDEIKRATIKLEW